MTEYPKLYSSKETLEEMEKPSSEEVEQFLEELEEAYVDLEDMLPEFGEDHPFSFKAVANDKIVDQETLLAEVDDMRAMDMSIVTLNGSFDLLHAGHLEIIFEAADQGDILVVALNSDASIKQYKSSDRPIIDLENRLKMIAALGCVDYVTWFDETDPRNLLEMIKPDVHVNGAEYGKTCIEAEVVEQNGGRVHIVELVPDYQHHQSLKRLKAYEADR